MGVIGGVIGANWSSGIVEYWNYQVENGTEFEWDREWSRICVGIENRGQRLWVIENGVNAN